MKWLISLTVMMLAYNCYAQQITGKVIRIADGDSFTILTADKKEIRIRLYGVDCPEHGQPYSKVAKEFTGKMLSEGQVIITQKDIDRYDRIVGIVIISDSINLNERLLRAGLAWHYKYFDKNPVWDGLEKVARESKKGLWNDVAPIAPWLWRKGNR